jgi:hypothetical protein
MGCAGVVFTGANVTLIDGFDVEFVQLVRRFLAPAPRAFSLRTRLCFLEPRAALAVAGGGARWGTRAAPQQRAARAPPLRCCVGACLQAAAAHSQAR